MTMPLDVQTCIASQGRIIGKLANRDCETLDRLYLEWSQFTQATTARELGLMAQIAALVLVAEGVAREYTPDCRPDEAGNDEWVCGGCGNSGKMSDAIHHDADCSWMAARKAIDMVRR